MADNRSPCKPSALTRRSETCKEFPPKSTTRSAIARAVGGLRTSKVKIIHSACWGRTCASMADNRSPCKPSDLLKKRAGLFQCRKRPARKRYPQGSFFTAEKTSPENKPKPLWNWPTTSRTRCPKSCWPFFSVKKTILEFKNCSVDLVLSTRRKFSV